MTCSVKRKPSAPARSTAFGTQDDSHHIQTSIHDPAQLRLASSLCSGAARRSRNTPKPLFLQMSLCAARVVLEPKVPSTRCSDKIRQNGTSRRGRTTRRASRPLDHAAETVLWRAAVKSNIKRSYRYLVRGDGYSYRPFNFNRKTTESGLSNVTVTELVPSLNFRDLARDECVVGSWRRLVTGLAPSVNLQGFSDWDGR
ncbi:hypothetical protein FB451DRAFT_1383054 [Mycena latifolia]|nr:hypothetical protein FB451DRAFT_1383054 [Mycena latifolia]